MKYILEEKSCRKGKWFCYSRVEKTGGYLEDKGEKEYAAPINRFFFHVFEKRQGKVYIDKVIEKITV